jgi:putative mRNA 3-end processing factor
MSIFENFDSLNVQIQVIIKNTTAKVPAHVTFSECGIIVSSGGKKISLDPSREISCDLTFVSHAHTDHLYKKKAGKDNFKGKTLVSKATSLIAQARGYTLHDVTDECEGFQLIDTGHIVGSKGLLIGDEVYYTADISIRERAFMRPALIPSAANTLVIESTFGRPEYMFPKITEIIHKTNKIISEMYDLGIPVVLMGYPLGKAQLLTDLFSHWDPVYVHDSVYNMNSIYKELGIPLRNLAKYSIAEKKGLLSKNKPWVMITPLIHARSNFVKYIKERYGAITIGFSGWAVNTGYKFMMGLDYTLPLSDHCDFSELVDVVKRCNPDKIYTFHGFSADFASSLQKMGFDADSITNTGLKRQKGKKKVPAPSLDLYIKT